MSLTKSISSASVTNRLLAMKFCNEFILIYPLITIMYSAYGHVSASGIGIILGLGLVLSVVLEIPTGILADKIPRKYVLFGSIFLQIAALLLWLGLHTFRGYLLAAVLFALSDAFESGTLQAYLYSVLGESEQKSFGKFWARVNAMILIAYTAAYVLTAVIGVNYPLLIGLSIIPCVIALILCASLPTDRLFAQTKKAKPKIFASAVRHIRASPELIKLIVGGIIIVAIAEVIIDYLPLYFNQVGVTTRVVPLVLAAGNLLGAASFWFLHRWEHSLDKLWLVVLVLVSALFVVSFAGGVVVGVVGTLLFTRYIRLLQVQYESNVQQLANDEARATISSIGTFGASLVGAIIMGMVGHFSADNRIVTSLRVALILGAIVYVCVKLLSRRKPAPTTTYHAEAERPIQ